VHELFERVLPEDVVTVRTAGLQERRLNALVLLRSMIFTASAGYGGRQASAGTAA
jgi:hypothetical protein